MLYLPPPPLRHALFFAPSPSRAPPLVLASQLGSDDFEADIRAAQQRQAAAAMQAAQRGKQASRAAAPLLLLAPAAP